MKTLKYAFLVITAVLFYFLLNQNNLNDADLVSFDANNSANWLDDLSIAKAKSQEEQKPILMYFTGSNWCSGCIRLNKDIFSKSAFIDFATEELILMKVDFPLGVQQKEDLINQNNYLYDLYEIEGMPTVILFDSNDVIYRETGYGKESVLDYIANLSGLLIK